MTPTKIKWSAPQLQTYAAVCITEKSLWDTEAGETYGPS